MDAKQFIDAVAELSDSKGLSREAIIYALEEAMKRAYIKHLGGGDDAVVTCTIDEEKGIIELAQIKKVVEEVEDDYLEISVEDANEGKKKAKYKVGDDYKIVCPIEDLSKVTAQAVRNNLRQRLSEAERTMLYDIYKDHIGEMMTGIVEKADERSITVKIDRTSIELTRKDLIGDEYFRVGDPVKVYIQEVKASEPVDGRPARGPQIQATRSSEGFLKRLFEEEIHEIYDGTVVIKAIARQPGVRAKVAVASNNEDVDATGACIGQGGNRIQKVVSQLGNGKNKEKIDVINWSPNIGMFMLEAIRPAQALGLNIDEEDKVAEVLIDDGAMPLALGKFKSNMSLAKKITGYDIDFVEKSKAEELGLIFGSIEEWKARAEEEKKEEERLAYIRKQQEEVAKREAEARKAAEEAAKREAELKAKEAEQQEEPLPEIIIKTPVVAPKADVRPEEFPASAVNPAAAALAADRAAKQAREAAAKAAEEASAQPTSVATTTTLDALEKELEEAKEKKTKSANKTKRPRKITEEEVSHETTVKPAVPTMPVYTEEELSQIESEEAEAYEDNAEDFDEDYSDYDDYYDDDPRN